MCREAVGFVPPAELGAYYERAAVVCVPSRREGYGVTAREAMALRAARRRDRRRRARRRSTATACVLVPPRDIGALRAAIEWLLADPGERARLGAAAREAAASRFSHDACARALVDVYESALRAT